MSIKDIIKGHINEAFNKFEDLMILRLEICQECKLLEDTSYGLICNNNLWLNVKTNETSTYKKPGFKRGCGCRLRAKTRLKDNHCPLGKW